MKRLLLTTLFLAACGADPSAPDAAAPTPDAAPDRTVADAMLDAALDTAPDVAPDTAPSPEDVPPPDVCLANTLRDPANCGACGRVCADTEDCQGGMCLNVVTPGCPSRCARDADCRVCPGSGGNFCCNSGRCFFTQGRCAGP